MTRESYMVASGNGSSFPLIGRVGDLFSRYSTIAFRCHFHLVSLPSPTSRKRFSPFIQKSRSRSRLSRQASSILLLFRWLCRWCVSLGGRDVFILNGDTSKSTFSCVTWRFLLRAALITIPFVEPSEYVRCAWNGEWRSRVRVCLKQSRVDSS